MRKLLRDAAGICGEPDGAGARCHSGDRAAGSFKDQKEVSKALLLFIVPPDAKTLLDRLRGRNTETEDVIQKRLARAAEESEGIEQYDYIIVNDDLEQSMELMHHLIESQHNKTDRNLAFIHQIQEEVREFVKGEK